MDQAEVLTRLLWDRRIIPIPSEFNFPYKAVLLHNPNIFDRNYAFFIKNEVYKQAIADEVPTETQVLEDAVWDEDSLITIKSTLDALESQLKNQKLSVKRKQIQGQINELQKSYATLVSTRENLCRMSAEYLANESYVFTLLQRTAFDFNGDLVWPTEEAFFRAKNDHLAVINYLCNQLLNDDAMSIKDIRAAARSTDWRIFWTLNRENLTLLFNQPITSFSMNQKILLYWSRIYDSAYEDTERPSETIINDDELFDEWLENRNLGKDKKKNSATDKHQEQMQVVEGHYIDNCTCGVGKTKVKGLGERSAHADDCKFGVYVPYTAAEKAEVAARIYNKNSGKVRQIIDHEQKAVEEKGLIMEQELRKRKTRTALGMAQKVGKKNG